MIHYLVTREHPYTINEYLADWGRALQPRFEILFYDDPHQLYKHWGPEIWKAVDAHQVILGMNERQVELSLGQVSKSTSKDFGNRMVVFANLGKPMAVTFVNNKVTACRADQGY